MKRCLAACAFASVLSAQAVAAAEPVPPAVLAQCQGCHGVSGDSTMPEIPRLAGQSQAYLRKRLNDFRDPTRQAPHATYVMWEISSRLSDARIGALAAYFSAQKPVPAQRRSARAAQGERLYRNGAGPNVPACGSCHGREGEGSGLYPRLAGQHATYLALSMADFSVQSRAGSPMNQPAMHLRDEQAAALVAYLAAD